MQDDFGNPFQFVQVGSYVRSGTKIKFGENLLNASITAMVKDSEVLKSIGGESDYIYSDTMNQGSGAFSGAWGVSGVATLLSSVAAYGGKSTASMRKSVKVNFDVLMRCGQEFVQFNNLSPLDLVNSLSDSPKRGLIEAFDAFVALRDLKSDQLLEATRDPASHPEVADLLQKWINSTTNFFKGFGDGLVVGVLWGGIGQVSMDIANEAKSSTRKYGNIARFSYEGIGASWSVKQAYDGSQNSKYNHVKAYCTSYYSGACVAESVNAWFQVYSNKLFSEICEEKPLDAPQITQNHPEAPSVPPFAKAPTDPKLADKFDKLTSLDGLQAYAIASAYDKLTPAEKEKISLDEFIKKQSNRIDIHPVEELKNDIDNNEIEIIIEPGIGIDFPSQIPCDPAPTPPKKPSDDYTPLGVWIANWSDLFPWLSTGCLNDFTDIDLVRRQLAKLVMMQDMLTLSRIYYYLAASDITTKSLGFSGYNDFAMVADKFQMAMLAIQDSIDNDNAVNLGYKQLDDSTVKGVYDFWRLKAAFLRNAELGLGISFNEAHSVSPVWKRNKIIGDYPTIYYESMKCPRTLGSSNGVFAQTLKGIPVIGGHGDGIGDSPSHPIYLFGPANMLLQSFQVDGDAGEAGFSRNVDTAMRFTPKYQTDGSGNKFAYLSSNGLCANHADIRLHPIRYSDAAVGDKWIGQTVSTNVGANGGLKKQLQIAKSQLSGLNELTLSSSTWDAQAKLQVKWSPKDPYVKSFIPMHYLGIVPEPGNH